jgi:hypothetical protein
MSDLPFVIYRTRRFSYNVPLRISLLPGRRSSFEWIFQLPHIYLID